MSGANRVPVRVPRNYGRDRRIEAGLRLPVLSVLREGGEWDRNAIRTWLINERRITSGVRLYHVSNVLGRLRIDGLAERVRVDVYRARREPQNTRVAPGSSSDVLV